MLLSAMCDLNSSASYVVSIKLYYLIWFVLLDNKLFAKVTIQVYYYEKNLFSFLK